MDDTLARASSPSLFATSTRGSLGSNQRSRSTSPSTIGTAPATPPQQPSTNLNATPRRGRRGRRKVLGLKTAHANQRGNDPFDYEQKYVEDEEFKEMGPMARIWKVFLDECGAFDSEMVEDWRDALDVLLVFAGLFSAVVTTFVSQLCQRLEADFTEINAHLMFESINIDRARAAGLSIIDVPRSQLTPFSRHRPSQTAVWVNGLWFTSLALSLTTALMAVLMKQWIHQYMSVPSGTPRDRSRIRQFRYMSLQQWQVPVIIGLLPVLMHIALGVFFAGLIVYLYSLNTVMSGVVTGIASTAFITYFLTNLLPLYKPGCPYKTPLTIHSYAFLVAVWDRVRTLTNARESAPSKEHLSLKSVEQERVTREADAIDAQSLAWLHDVSSNSSVQRIVLQAISNLPLGPSVETVRQAIPNLDLSISLCLEEYGTSERRNGYERLTRALIRFDKEPMESPTPFQENPIPNSLLGLISPNSHDAAITASFLVQQILNPTAQMDPISWLWVLRNALAFNIDWLEIARHDSIIWAAFLDMFLRPHDCHNPFHLRKEVASIHLDCPVADLPIQIRNYEGFNLAVYESDGHHREHKSTSDAIHFNRAVVDFMYPSLCEFLLSAMVFSPSLVTADETLPSDIRLHLALLQTANVQRAQIPFSRLGKPPIRQIINFIMRYVDLEEGRTDIFAGPIVLHHQLPGAIFASIHTIVTKTNAFETRIRHADQSDLMHILFRCLVLDKNLREKHKHWLAEPSSELMKKILGIVFHRPRIFSFPLITEILDYFFLSKSIIGVEMYRGLLQGEWYEFLRLEFMVTDDDDGHALSDEERGWGAADYAHSFIVVSFIDGLEVLEEVSLALHEQTLENLRVPANLLILCKVLILADIDSRSRLWKLAKLVGRDQWKTCMANLSEFLLMDRPKGFYQEQSSYYAGHNPYHQHVNLRFSPFEELRDFVDQYSQACEWERGNFPLTTPIFNAPKQLEDFSPCMFRIDG